jgi:Spy/CpxP family protein refolding chaperone
MNGMSAGLSDTHMKRLQEWLWLLALAAVLLGGARFAQADEDDQPAVIPGQPPINGIVVSPMLNATQRGVYRQAIEANKEKIQSLQQQIVTARKALFDVQLAPTFDEAAFRKHAQEVLQAQTEIEVLNAEAFAKVRPSFTPEQLERLKTSPTRVRPHGGPEARPGVFPMGAPGVPMAHGPITNRPPGAASQPAQP